MSHDFAKKGQAKNSKRSPQKNTRKPQKKPIAGWVWFVTGVLVTLFAQFLIHLASLDDSQDSSGEKQTNSKTSQKEAASQQKAKKPKLQYRFYEELKQKQVTVEAEKVAEREQEDYNYALQAGSFKNKQDAEQMRAEIILLGLDARIEPRTSKTGTVWNRVIVGPFTSRSKLQQARSTLINNNVPTMVFKHD